MSNFPRANQSTTEDYAWRIAGFFSEADRAPTVEISEELDQESEPHEYLPAIGESLIELGVMLMKYTAEDFEDAPKRRPSPHPKPKKVEEKPIQRKEIELGGYL